MKNKKYSGVVVPMVTPFTNRGEVDLKGVGNLIEHVASNNCHPFILGTTGEALSISLKMKMDYLKKAIEVNKGRGILYAGIASMCLEDSVEMAKLFFDEGVDVVVAHLPCYYKISDDSIRRYFIELADRINGPLILYNISATTHMSIPISVIDKLSRHPNIVGLKDSERNEERMLTLLKKFSNDQSFSYQLGWAAQSLEFLKNGGDGIVPSTGNAFPQLYYRLYQAIQKGDYQKAGEIQQLTDKITEIYQKDKLLSESLPGLKVILECLGLCEANALAPCFELSESQVRDIQIALKALKIDNK